MRTGLPTSESGRSPASRHADDGDRGARGSGARHCLRLSGSKPDLARLLIETAISGCRRAVPRNAATSRRSARRPTPKPRSPSTPPPCGRSPNAAHPSPGNPPAGRARRARTSRTPAGDRRTPRGEHAPLRDRPRRGRHDASDLAQAFIDGTHTMVRETAAALPRTAAHSGQPHHQPRPGSRPAPLRNRAACGRATFLAGVPRLGGVPTRYPLAWMNSPALPARRDAWPAWHHVAV
jgi:hypothetical protein